MGLSLTLLIYVLSSMRAATSYAGYPSCTTPGVTWRHDDVVAGVADVQGVEECRTMCAQSASRPCALFTWFDELGFPLPRFCFLFASVAAQEACEHCVSGGPSCPCGYPISCDIVEGNLLGRFTSVPTQEGCRAKCRGVVGCNFYTWHTAEDQAFSEECYTFSSCDVTSEGCQTCLSGTPGCSGVPPNTTTTSLPATTTSGATTTAKSTTENPHTTTGPSRQGEFAIIVGGSSDAAVKVHDVETWSPTPRPDLPSIPNLPAWYAWGNTFWTSSNELVVLDDQFTYTWSIASPSEWRSGVSNPRFMDKANAVLLSDGKTILIIDGVTTGFGTYKFTIQNGWQSITNNFDKTYYEACLVSMPDQQVVITGGAASKFSTALTQASLLDEDGNILKVLPSMREARAGHGCSRLTYQGRQGIMVAGGSSTSTRAG